MKTFFTILFLIHSFISFSQQRWIKSFPENLLGGGNGKTVCSDADQNVIIGGTNSTTGGVLLKYDVAGNLLWFDSSTTTFISKIICVGNNIIATGSSLATTVQDRMFIAKWDSSGTLLWIWQDTLSGINDQSFGFDMIINNDGNIFAVGQPVSHNGFVSNILAVGLDPNGSLLWEKNYTGTDYYFLFDQSANKLASDSAGNIYMSLDEYIPSYRNVKLSKFNKTTGDTIWTHTYDSGPDSYDVGRFIGILNGGTLVENNTASSTAPYNYAIVFHFDLAGNIVDSIVIPDDYPFSVVMDSHGNIISGGLINFNGNYPIQLRKHSYSGAFIDSALIYGYSGNIGFKDMTIDDQDNIYLAFEDKIFCDSANFTAVKLDPGFNQLWIDSMDAGTGAEDSPNEIYINSHHDIIMTGLGNFVCPSSDQTITTAFWSDAFITATDHKINLSDALTVFPNPTRGKINIELGKDFDPRTKLIIYDLLGNVVLEKMLNDKACSVELNLKPGLYFMNFLSNRDEVRKKIVVE